MVNDLGITVNPGAVVQSFFFNKVAVADYECILFKCDNTKFI